MSNYILIKTDHQNKLEYALYDLANLYPEVPCTKGIQLYREKGNPTDFLIRFNNQPDFVQFCYYVNYLEYPFDLDQFQFTVRGYYQSSGIEEFPVLKQGRWIMLYVNTESSDNVYLVDERNNSFIYDFGGKMTLTKESLLPYKFPEIAKEDYHHITDIYPTPKDKSQKKVWWKFW